MADLQAAIDYVLTWEDRDLTGKITVDESGYRTRYGIDERFHPELRNSLFYTSMGQMTSLRVARGIYEQQYCETLCIAEIPSQDVANKLLSLGVNIGVVSAAKILQDCLKVEGDGHIGPCTLLVLDSANPQTVLEDFKKMAEQWYEQDVIKNPKLKKYLKGWEIRASA